MPVKSDNLRARLDASNLGVTYLYSKFSCEYPNPIGAACPLQLAIGGRNDGKHHEGGLFVADAGSKTKRIPVYINYHVIAEPHVVSYDPEFPENPKLKVWNYSNNEDYAALLAVTDQGQQLATSGCQSLGRHQSCTLELDLGNVAPDTANAKIYGLSASQLQRLRSTNNLKKVVQDIPEIDSMPIKLNLTNPDPYGKGR